MPHPKNAMEIFQLLEKSNCRECGEKTCLAFAGAVFRGQAKLDDCPRLDREMVERFCSTPENHGRIEENRDAFLAQLKNEASAIDLAAAADRTGGRYCDGKLTLKVLGKNFSVDTNGRLSTEIHVNPWVAVPFLDYVINAKGISPSGNWVSYRELDGGQERYPLFQKRCEEPMKQVADVYTELFEDMVHLFNGRQVEEQFESDISVVLRPLPKVPVMICYWRPEEGLASSLNVFFDSTAAENLDIGSIFTLGAGLAQMFQRLAIRHGCGFTS